MKLLSIIIPIYNVEPFVEKCLRSLLVQDMPRSEYEIICVNDGSPDNSRDVVLAMQAESENIILIDQENQGVSMARSNGIDRSSGKYLLFIDPDDYVVENSLGPILVEANSRGAHMTIPGYIYVDSNGNELGNKILDRYVGKSYTGIEAYHLLRKERHLVVDSSVGIILEANFLKVNQLRYLADVPLNQDVELLARIHCLAERCIFVKQLSYVACARKGSATRSNQFSTERVRNGFKRAASNLRSFQEKDELSEQEMLFINGPLVQFVLLTIYSAVKSRSAEDLKAAVKSLKEEGFRKLNLEGCVGYHVTCGKAYNISPYLGAFVLVMYLKIESLYNTYVVKKRDF